MKAKYLLHLAVLSILVLLFPLGALARDKAHSVEIDCGHGARNLEDE